MSKMWSSRALRVVSNALLVISLAHCGLANFIEGSDLPICKEGIFNFLRKFRTFLHMIFLLDRNPCPNGYIYSSDLSTCYQLKTKPKSTWNQAQNYCMAEGGDLASVTDGKENAFIKGRIIC